MSSVVDRSLLVDIDVKRPSRVIDCDIFLNEQVLDLDTSLGNSSVEFDMSVGNYSIEIENELTNTIIEISFSVDFGGKHYEYYNGEYVITPTFDEQTMATKEKLMKHNVTVKEIPVNKVSNPYGGLTVTIG